MKTLLLIAPLLRSAYGLPTPRGIPDMVREHLQQERDAPEEGLLYMLLAHARATEGDDAATDGDVETQYCEQRLDHFSADGDGSAAAPTFRQRYFYSARYVGAAGDPGKAVAFLCVGGEGPSLSPAVLVDSVHCTGDMLGLAARLHEGHGYDVHLFALEHRYYGESFPGTDYADYAHLSSRQAVRDVVAFVRSPEARRRLDPTGDAPEEAAPWITFGGSYPGMLSAWSRLLHPDAVFASVASSAPVEARLDFVGYHDKVGADLADARVGGSAACAQIVREGHAEVVAALEEGEGGGEGGGGPVAEDGVDRVARLFDVCGGADALRGNRRNQEMLVGDGVINVPAQGNDPSCEEDVCNIEKLCAAIEDQRQSNPDSSSMEILARIAKRQFRTCAFVDWKQSLRYYNAPTKSKVNDRSWMYQTCTEFGFYQSCNHGSECPFGQGYHPVAQDLEQCKAVFGIEPAVVEANVEATLAYYGGWALTPVTPQQPGLGLRSAADAQVREGQKRILFVSGDVDPWGVLAVQEGTADHPSVVVPGASHHFWTHAPEASDGDAVRAARDTIYETLSGWLGVDGGEAPPERLVSSVGAPVKDTK